MSARVSSLMRTRCSSTCVRISAAAAGGVRAATRHPPGATTHRRRAHARHGVLTTTAAHRLDVNLNLLCLRMRRGRVVAGTGWRQDSVAASLE